MHARGRFSGPFLDYMYMTMYVVRCLSSGRTVYHNNVDECLPCIKSPRAKVLVEQRHLLMLLDPEKQTWKSGELSLSFACSA